MKRQVIFVVCGLLIGCPDAAGRPCGGPPDCPSGYSCVPTAYEPLTQQCLPSCERRSDCMGGETCARSFATPPTCDRYGSRPLGASCLDLAWAGGGFDECGPGLRCTSSYAPAICRPACEYLSPHSEDRACPAGTICEMTGLNVCLDLCDPDDPNACDRANGVSCVRYSHATLGVIGVCYDRGPWTGCENGVRCTGGQVCAEGTCHDPVDAPALPWPIGPDAPPLVD
jgi:hypothetical protein